MGFGAENHELRFDGVPKPETLEKEISGELDIQEECMHLRQQIEEDCNFHPDYIWCINQLGNDYSTFELEHLVSKYTAEEVSARNALLFAPKGEHGDLLDKLRQAMMANIMLRKALENNREES